MATQVQHIKDGADNRTQVTLEGKYRGGKRTGKWDTFTSTRDVVQIGAEITTFEQFKVSQMDLFNIFLQTNITTEQKRDKVVLQHFYWFISPSRDGK